MGKGRGRNVTVRVGLAFVAIACFVVISPRTVALNGQARGTHEIWLVDQSNSVSTFGGRIYIFQGPDVAGQGSAKPEVLDLGGATTTLCAASTGANAVRPHMLAFNSTYTHAILSFVVSGHVVIFDAATRIPQACFRMSIGAGGARQAHAAFPTPDDSLIVVANQNGKLLERIRTNYAIGQYTHETAATLDLANGLTPNNVPRQAPGIRPDNAPICPMIDPTGTLAFVTLRGGGLFVVRTTTTPMSIVGEYDLATVHPNGCGGSLAAGAIFVNSGGGTATNLAEFDVYKFPLSGYTAANPANTPPPVVLFSDERSRFAWDARDEG